MSATAEVDFARKMQAEPVWACENVLGSPLWSKQREVIESVRDNARTAVKSGHGVGKTYIAARTAIWFLYAFPGSRVVTTAPTWTQVEMLLWKEIAACHANAPVELGGRCNKTDLQVAPNWFAIGLSTNEPEKFAGHHAPKLLLVVDEASGVDEAIFEAGEGFLTARGGRILLIGNPTRAQGQLHRAFTKERDLWNTITISCMDSPNLTGKTEGLSESMLDALVSREWVDEKVKKWGRDSAIFQIRVLGQFYEGADDVVIGLAACEDAAQRFKGYEPVGLPPVTISCDVARFGSDESVIGVKEGDWYRQEAIIAGQDTQQVGGRVVATARNFDPAKLRIVVDDDGVGGGVADVIRSNGYKVDMFHGSGSPLDSEDYPNRRSEAWFAAREAIKTAAIEDDEQLIADLTAPIYTFDAKGRRQVEPKKDTKKRLGRSPDRGDTYVMACAPPVRSGIVTASGDEWERRVVEGGLWA